MKRKNLKTLFQSTFSLYSINASIFAKAKFDATNIQREMLVEE